MTPTDFNLITAVLDIKANPKTINAVELYLVHGFTLTLAAEKTGVQIAAIHRLAKRINKIYFFAIDFCKKKPRRA